jgi:hypothetical protein
MSKRGGLTSILGAVVLLVTPSVAHAAPFNPTRFDDPVPNGCQPADCSLREAVIDANAAPGADTITLAAGTYELQIAGPDENLAANGDLDLTGSVTITGAGRATTTVDANGAATGERVFDVPNLGPGAISVDMSSLTLTGATAVTGSGMRVDGLAPNFTPNVTLTDVAVSGNTAPAGFGAGLYLQDSVVTIRGSVISGNSGSNFAGGIYNTGTQATTIEDSIISGNSSINRGGAVYLNNNTALTVRRTLFEGNTAVLGGAIHNQNDSVMTIADSTLHKNVATDDGAAFFLKNSAKTTVVNTTVSGNVANRDGGAVAIGDAHQATITNSTLTANRADGDGNGSGDGGGIFVDPDLDEPGQPFTGAIRLSSTIVAGNSDSAAGAVHRDCSGTPVTSLGFNLVGDATGCGLAAAASDQVGTGPAPIDPLLGALGANGGPTPTHLPAAGSPALDSGIANGLAADQRGFARTVNSIAAPNRFDSDGTDVGAVEVQDAAPAQFSCRGSLVPRTDGTDGKDTLTGTGGTDAIFGLGGADVIRGDGGGDCLDGGGGRDRLGGGSGKDKLTGGGGRDVLRGGGGKDKIKTGGGRDKVNCGGGRDKVNAGGKDKVARNCERVV